MTQEKELLLKDLCARLPYGVKVNVIYSNENASSFRQRVCVKGDNELTTDIIGLYQRDEIDIKPYLLPLSSITDEQNDSWRDAWFPDLMTSTDVNYPESEKYLALSHAKSLEWLYKNHFDVNRLIEKGLAIDATGLNIY